MKKHLLFTLVILTLLSSYTYALSAPDFTLPSLSGQSVSLHDFLGKKAIVINFWASWCTSCEEEMPQLLKLKESAGSDVVFLGINAGDSQRAAQRFVDKTGYNYEILLDSTKNISKSYEFKGIPATIVINRQGDIVFSGSRPPQDLSTLSQP